MSESLKYILVYNISNSKILYIGEESEFKVEGGKSKYLRVFYLSKQNLNKLFLWSLGNYGDLDDSIKKYFGKILNKGELQKVDAFFNKIFKYCIANLISVDLEDIFGENFKYICVAFLDIIRLKMNDIKVRYSNGTKPQRNIYNYILVNKLDDEIVVKNIRDELNGNSTINNIQASNKEKQLEDTIKSLQKSLSDKDKTLANRERTIKQLKKDNKELRSSVNTSEIDKLNNLIKSKDAEIKTLKHNHNQLRESKNKTSAELSTAKSKINMLENELTSIRSKKLLETDMSFDVRNLLSVVKGNISIKTLTDLMDLLNNAIYFDSNKKNSDKLATCKISVRGIDAKSKISTLIDPFLLNDNGDLELCEQGLDNNLGEMVAFYYALKIANTLNVKAIIGDSMTAMTTYIDCTESEYISRLDKITVNGKKLPSRYYKLYKLTKEELIKFDKGCILWVKDVLNPAD